MPSESEWQGGLLVRVWAETGDPTCVRARVLTFNGSETPRDWTTRTGEDAVVDAVATWVRAQLHAHLGRGQPPT